MELTKQTLACYHFGVITDPAKLKLIEAAIINDPGAQQYLADLEPDAESVALDNRSQYFVKACSPKFGLAAHGSENRTLYRRLYPAWESQLKDAAVNFRLEPHYGFSQDGPTDGDYYRVYVSGEDSSKVQQIAFVSEDTSCRTELCSGDAGKWFVNASELSDLIEAGLLIHCEIDGELIKGELPVDAEVAQ